MGDKFSDVGNAIKNFLAGVEDSIEGTVKGLLTLVADLGILYVYSECTQTVSGYVPEVLDQEVEKIKQKYEPLLKDPVNTIGGIGQSICDTADEKGVAYSSGYIVTEVVTALLADKGLDKLKNVAKTGKTADNVADIAEGAGNAAEDAGKELEEAAKGAESAAEDAGKVVETSYGKSSGKYDTTADFLTNIENRNGKFYTDKATIDKIGQVEARGEDFSLLNKRIMSSRASTEGGTSVVYKYSDELGTKYLIHEVTDARGYIIHRDFDAVRISSGQLINKGH